MGKLSGTNRLLDILCNVILRDGCFLDIVWAAIFHKIKYCVF